MAKRNYTIVDCDKDGNCLFRSVALQVFNDVTKHEAVRKACYDHMVCSDGLLITKLCFDLIRA